MPNQVVAVGGNIWVTAQDERVLRIDPQRNKIVKVIEVPEAKPLTKSLLGGLVHVPDLKNALQVRTPGKLTGLAITGDVMWVADWANNVLWKVDIPTAKTFGVPLPVGSHPLILGPGNDGSGAVWISNSGDATVMQLKPNSF
jgi:streptogramin lyase